jgi:hypothetical protein
MKTVELPVTGGHKTLVDEDTAERLKGKKLFLASNSRYVSFTEKKHVIAIHRLVMGNPEGMLVDHKFGNRFDNRRSQLRICSSSANQSNRRHKTRCKSGYRLVYRKFNKYHVEFGRKNYIYVGTAFSRHVGGIFADEFLVEHVGDFVLRNFSESIHVSELRDFLESTAGRIFRVVFSRRSDGRQREMLCRTGVHKSQKGKSLAFDPSEKSLFSVYDISKKMYRFIPLDRVICLRYRKTNYRVIYKPVTPSPAA